MPARIELVEKPVGVSSHQHLRALGHPRACHGGTLDPFADGLLLVLVDEATKLFPFLHDVPKRYEARIAWGTETTTGDPGGAVVLAGPPPSVAAREAALPSFLGWTEQVPPATSARRVGGERAYERVFRGEEVVLPPTRVYLHEATWLGHGPDWSRLQVVVRGGFYVRALARDLGRAAGAGAHLSALRRLSIGPWSPGGPPATGRAVLPWAPSVDLSRGEMARAHAGAPLRVRDATPAAWPLPEGFGPPPVLGLWRGEPVAVLTPAPEGWRAAAKLRA